MSTLIAGTYTGAATKIASAIASGYSVAYANGTDGHSALFANGEKGVIYDPSDFSTMFQDSAGTTPVTAVGQTVGMMLDKSKGLVLGSELVTNGGFADATGWSAPIAGASITGGVLAFDGATSIAVGATITSETLAATVVGSTYKLTYQIVSNTTLPISITFAGTGTTARSAAGTYTEYVVASNTTGTILIIARTTAGARTGSVDNVSVKELPGYHATQPTSTSRPMLTSHVSPLGSFVYELTGDGVDNRLTSATSGGGTTGILLCAAIKPAATAAATIWSDAGTNTGYKLTLDATNHIVLSAGNGTAYTSVTGPVLTAGTEYVVMAWHDGVNLNVQVNGGAITSAAFGTATAGTAGFSVLADNGTAANWFNGTVASLIYRQNDTSTATDRTNVLAYVNSKAGAF